MKRKEKCVQKGNLSIIYIISLVNGHGSYVPGLFCLFYAFSDNYVILLYLYKYYIFEINDFYCARITRFVDFIRIFKKVQRKGSTGKEEDG